MIPSRPSIKMSESHPLKAIDFDLVKNWPLTPDTVFGGTHKKLWWVCRTGDSPCGNSWAADRSGGAGCPECGRKKSGLNRRRAIGLEYGRWRVLRNREETERGERKGTFYLCVCACGESPPRLINANTLWSGDSKSCGCLKSELTSARCLDDLSGQVFGHLTVTGRALNTGGKTRWRCDCACGNAGLEVGAEFLQAGQKTCGRSCSYYVGGRRHTPPLEGLKFGRLLPVYRVNNSEVFVTYSCLCDCGNTAQVKYSYLTSGRVVSCGCLHDESARRNFIDRTGHVFGQLTVIERVSAIGEDVRYLCSCACGETTIVASDKLVSGTKSCGCLRRRTGEDNPLYDQTITQEDRDRSGRPPEIVCWRKAVYKRDAYACVLCNDNTGGNLNAHHLDGWHWCKERRFDVSNGMTLCEDCHDEFHSEYGYRNNTEQQFADFIYAIADLIDPVGE